MTQEHEYRLRYAFNPPEPGHFTKADAKDGHGLTDALMVVSVLFPEDGSRSEGVYSDGRAGTKFKFRLEVGKAENYAPSKLRSFRVLAGKGIHIVEAVNMERVKVWAEAHKLAKPIISVASWHDIARVKMMGGEINRATDL